MPRKVRHGIAATLSAALLAIGAAAFAQNSGTDLPAEAVRSSGAAAYAKHCAACHGPDLNGPVGPNPGVALRGPVFVAKWGATPAALLEYISKAMPLQDRGSLDPATYSTIVDFIQAENGVQARAAAPSSLDDVAGASARSIALTGPDKEQPDPLAIAARERLDALAAKVSPVTDDTLRNPADSDWIAWRGSQSTTGFSPLRQIDRDNVAQLGLAWSLALGNGTNAIAPLVHDGVMYFNSNGTVRALDASNGDIIWENVRPAITTQVPKSQSHGIALYGDSIIVPTMDNHIQSLDTKTGKLRWDRVVGKDGEGLQLTAAPLIAHGKVIQGVSGCQGTALKGGCYILALDAATGNEVWRFYTIARPGTPGGDSWNGAPLDRRFGSSVWTTGSYDPELNLVYFGTGQTYIVSTLLDGPGTRNSTRDALYTNTTLALNPDTGKLVWHYQHVAGDVWDLDWAFERTLATVPGPNGPRKIVVTMGKTAIIDALDARTGKYLWSLDMGFQTLIKAIDPVTGRKSYDPSLTPERGKLKLVCPGSIGARNWTASAYDPGSGLLYFPMFDTCNDIGMVMENASNPLFNTYGEFNSRRRPRPGSDGQFGRIAAIDLATGKLAWNKTYRAQPISALLTTAGGVVFTGSRDRWFSALDSEKATRLWRTRLDNVPNGFPITYMVNGRQYVAIITGGGTPLELSLRNDATEIQSPGASKTLMVFALPEKAEQ